jgi:hypothetical protein
MAEKMQMIPAGSCVSGEVLWVLTVRENRGLLLERGRERETKSFFYCTQTENIKHFE